MFFPIVNVEYPLVLSASFIVEVENVINRNSDSNVSLVALFISRLIKGLQNLTCSDDEYSISWGNLSYEIEDIGVVDFTPLVDDESREKVLYISMIRWTFATSRFFSEFSY